MGVALWVLCLRVVLFSRRVEEAGWDIGGGGLTLYSGYVGARSAVILRTVLKACKHAVVGWRRQRVRVRVRVWLRGRVSF